MYKEFSSARVCAIDYYPLFLDALKETYLITRKYNLSFKANTKDVQKFFYHYCLEKFCSEYKKCKTKFAKVLVVYPLPKDVFFTDKNLQKILNVLPVPWVKCSSFDSPDVEMGCVRALNKNRSIGSRFNNFANKHSLHKLLISHKNLKLFTNGSVDYSSVQD